MTETYSNIVDQASYILDETRPDFYVRTIETPGVQNKVDDLLLLEALMIRSGCTSKNEPFAVDDTQDTILTTLMTRNPSARLSETISSCWTKNSSGTWGYIVR